MRDLKEYGGVEVVFHSFIISAIYEDECVASRSGRFTNDIHWIEGFVGPTTGLDALEKR